MWASHELFFLPFIHFLGCIIHFLEEELHQDIWKNVIIEVLPCILDWKEKIN